jgi:hypothetical protein
MRPAVLLLLLIACGGGGGPPDASPGDATPVAVETCTYWPLAPGPSCGEQIYGTEPACVAAMAGCTDNDLLGVGYCFETADAACDPACLPACAAAPPGDAP